MQLYLITYHSIVVATCAESTTSRALWHCSEIWHILDTFVLDNTCRPNVLNHSFGKQEVETFYETLTLLVSLDIDIPESIGIEKSLVVKDQC